MTDDTLPLDLTNTADTPRYIRGGGVVRERVYTFYLGKHGPMTFRTPLDPFDPNAFQAYVNDQRAHLRAAQRV